MKGDRQIEGKARYIRLMVVARQFLAPDEEDCFSDEAIHELLEETTEQDGGEGQLYFWLGENFDESDYFNGIEDRIVGSVWAEVLLTKCN